MIEQKDTNAKFTNFIASEIGFYEKNGLSIEYIARGTDSTRNIICVFNVKSKDINRTDYSTEAETSYFSKKIDSLSFEEQDNTRFVNDFVCKLYYEMIV